MSPGRRSLPRRRDPDRIELDLRAETRGLRALDLLAEASTLSKQKLKEAMTKGAVWLKPARRGPRRRLRRHSATLQAGDLLQLRYDPRILALEPPAPRCLDDRGEDSVWYKPAGLLSQGSEHGDHCALTRLAELELGRNRTVFVVHRLDREARGLMILAHEKRTAAALGQLFQQQRIDKTYRARVRGDLAASLGVEAQINASLDGKAARTRLRVLGYDAASDSSAVELHIDTGRLHQIRRHLDGVGHPVLGDPRYGKDNGHPAGLQLVACGLAFTCPRSGAARSYRLDDEEIGI